MGGGLGPRKGEGRDVGHGSEGKKEGADGGRGGRMGG